MTRSSDIPGSYREWAAEQKAADQAEKRAEQQRKARERDRLAQEAIARDDEATAKTAAVDRQIATLQGLLRESLSRDPRIDLATLYRRAKVPPLELTIFNCGSYRGRARSWRGSRRGGRAGTASA